MRIPFLPRSLYARIVVLVCVVLVIAQVLADHHAAGPQ